MPFFRGHKRPPLDGLTKDEERRRDEINLELTRRTEGRQSAAETEAVLEVLREKADSDRVDFLWPLLLGWQLMRIRRWTAAVRSFQEASVRAELDVRPYFGGGSAYMQAGRAAQSMGSGVTEAMVPPNMTAEDLYREADRCFKAALGLTSDKDEILRLTSAVAEVERALARSAKRPDHSASPASPPLP